MEGIIKVKVGKADFAKGLKAKHGVRPKYLKLDVDAVEKVTIKGKKIL